MSVFVSIQKRTKKITAAKKRPEHWNLRFPPSTPLKGIEIPILKLAWQSMCDCEIIQGTPLVFIEATAHSVKFFSFH